MLFQDLIAKKRDGGTLSHEEIRVFVTGAARGTVPDYQLSAMLMAIFLQGMDARETLLLTLEMAASGEQCDLSGLPGVTLDKHSSGGVADTVTLVLAPMLAACGGTVAKMSGRGLGFSGGTVDKLESIPGMMLDLPMERFIEQAGRIGLCVTGQSASLAPADKILYALRDATATVESIPLIASSIMSKKLAAGAQCILLDVKCGGGAFMKTKEQAQKLAETMVHIGKGAGRRMAAVVTDMNVPLGSTIGNSLELIEAIEVLKGRQGGRLLELCLILGSRLLTLAGIYQEKETAKSSLQKSIQSGAALKKLREMITAQGGDAGVLEDYALLPRCGHERQIFAKEDGYIGGIRADRLGHVSLLLGAGRREKGDAIDYGAGIVLHKNIGDFIKAGEALATLHFDPTAEEKEAAALTAEAFSLQAEPPEEVPLVYSEIL